MEYKPCLCGEEKEIYIRAILETFKQNLYIIECNRCGEFMPCKIDPWLKQSEVSDKCWEIWNQHIK
jgi:hypothetical protein